MTTPTDDGRSGKTPRDATTISTGDQPAAVGTAEASALVAELREAIAPDLILLSPLGEGGMGTVFLARDPALKRNVVVKALRAELAKDLDARRRFEREAQAAATVSHPNVVGVYRVGQLPRSGTSYFVMQHVAGPSLEHAFPVGVPLPEMRAQRIVSDMASALAAAHEVGVVHRDIKPANVMIESATDRVVVVDFGISAVAGGANRGANTKLTQQGTSVGTPRYMSPEQASGEEATEKSDVYSLGLVAFELLTGRPPFDETNVMGYIAAHINKVPARVTDVRRDVHPTLGSLVDRMLSKDPARRPTALEVARTLAPERHVQVEWPPPGLEKLQGAGARVLRAILLFVAGLLALQWFDNSLLRDLAISLVFAGLALSVLREVSLEDSIFLGWRSGYPIAVLIDVALDRAGDAREILSGIGVFATVAPAQRARLLLRRRWSAAGIIAGALASLVLAVVHAADPRIADRMLPSDFAAMAWPVVAAAAIDWWVRWRETTLRRSRGGAFPVSLRRRVDLTLVNAWLASAGRKEGRAPNRIAYSGFRWIVVAGSELVLSLFVGIAIVILLTPRLSSGDTASADELSATLAMESQVLHRVTAAALPLSGAVVAGGAAATTSSFIDSSVTPSPATLRRAWRMAPNSERALTDTLHRFAGARELGPWRAMAGARIPPFFYWVPDSALMRDSAGVIVRRASNFMTSGALRNSAAAALALAEGDARGARARIAEMARVGAALVRDPRVVAHDAGVAVLEAAADAWGEFARVTKDSVQARQARDLAGAANSARSSLLRTQRTWADAFGQAAVLDSARIRVWRIAVRDETLPPFMRSIAIDGLVVGICGNRQEITAGPSEQRRALLAELPALVPPGDARERWLALSRWRVERMSKSAGYRYGYCAGKRSGALL